MDEERLMEPELVAMQRVARELEGERDAALTEVGRLRQLLRDLQGYIDRVHENAIRVQELEEERGAALAREAVLREALDGLLPAPGADPKRVNAALGILATPSPAAEALQGLALAAENEWHNWQHGLSGCLGEDWQRLHKAVEKWQRARG